MSDLNSKQKEAVQHPGGPLLIAAGAGSGKTKTLTSRLIHLIESGLKPENIIAITFTNKAAQEMRDRIKNNELPARQQLMPQALAGGPARQALPVRHEGVSGGLGEAGGGIKNYELFIGTFHSLGARILKTEGKYFGRTAGYTIFDDDDSLSLIKKITKEMNLDKEQYNPLMFQAFISKIKNELMDEPNSRIHAQVFHKYEETLAECNAFDFDDLIQKVVLVFTDEPEILQKYQKQWQHVLVDEFQDVNTSQYEMVRLLAAKHQNLSVVGDDFQCLPPDAKIKTPKGEKEIIKLRKGDKVISAAGNGQICVVEIKEIKKYRHKGPLIKITTISGKTIKLTPNHITFMRLPLIDNIYYVYLMYRQDKGFRIGIVKGTRTTKGEKQVGLLVRNNQERADKIWVLKVCDKRSQAEYWEFYYSFQFGIPTVVFDTGGRSMKIEQKQIDDLYKNINTIERARKLMGELLISASYPHSMPQGTIRHRSRRLRIRLAVFDDRRRSITNPWGMSRISICTKDLALKKEIEALGFKTRKGKLNDWRLEIASLDYGKIEEIGDKIKNNIKTDVEIVRNACLTENKRLFFQPASHAREKMIIAVFEKGVIVEDIIKKVEVVAYDGNVYDLEVENLHNYIAEEVVVHNSIYGFRGADYRNFLNFEKDWPNAKIVLLEENYRSTASIIQAAGAVIKNNKLQKPKTLWTQNPKGDSIQIIVAQDENEEAEWVVNQIKLLRFKHLNSLAVLYRTNAQSRAIEQNLIAAGIPYKIFGGIRFYDRKEIKDIVAALRLASNPNDIVSAERLLKGLPKIAAREIINDMPRLGKELNVLELINYFLNTANYFDYLEKHQKNAEERIENINELIVFAGQFVLKSRTNADQTQTNADKAQTDADIKKDSKRGLREFLEQVSLASSLENPAIQKSNQPAVQLMTIHLAKGLEFDTVFVIGCNEGTLPHHRSYEERDGIEEERRLMYVAMTRARKNLFLSFYNIASRFLYEIPPELIDFIKLENSRRKKYLEAEDNWIEY